MRRALATLTLSGILAIGGLGTNPARAQYGYDYRGGAGIPPTSSWGGGYSTPGYSTPGYGVGCPPGGYGGGVGVAGGYGGYGAAGAAGGYGGLPGYNPSLPYSPAQQQGYREGKVYYETGIAPNRPLSPAEAQGFVAGERRAASTPWQLDPARQQGYREGQLYWETGIAPNRPLAPAEAQGFYAGERRAAGGYYRPY